MVTDQMNEHSFILHEAPREIKEFFAETRHFLYCEAALSVRVCHRSRLIRQDGYVAVRLWGSSHREREPVSAGGSGMEIEPVTGAAFNPGLLTRLRLVGGSESASPDQRGQPKGPEEQ